VKAAQYTLGLGPAPLSRVILTEIDEFEEEREILLMAGGSKYGLKLTPNKEY